MTYLSSFFKMSNTSYLFLHLFTEISPVLMSVEIKSKYRDRGASFGLRLIDFTFGVEKNK